MMIMVASAGADPTVQTLGGKTCVKLDRDFAEFPGKAEISIDIIKPAKALRIYVCFPIVGGANDLETLRGKFIHTGGLGLIQEIEATEDEAGKDEPIVEEKIVELISFIIDTSDLEVGAPPVLT
jgi:hypothetical protein